MEEITLTWNPAFFNGLINDVPLAREAWALLKNIQTFREK